LLLVVNLLLLIVFFAKPVAGSTFFLFVISLLLWLPILYLAWRAWASFTLAYWIDRNAITVVYGPVRQTIPLGDIQEIRRGQAVADWQAGAPVVQGPNGEADWGSAAGRDWRAGFATARSWARGGRCKAGASTAWRRSRWTTRFCW